MKDESFEEGRPRTPRGEAIRREKQNRMSIEALLRLGNEDAVRASLEKEFGLMRGQPQFEAALKIWRESSRRR